MVFATRTAAIAVVLLLGSPAWFGSAFGIETSEEPTLVADANEIVIDAGRGTVERQDRNAAETDVRVDGVPPGVDGFNLVAPDGVLLYEGQRSTYGGSVSFWRVHLPPGTYRIVLNASEGAREIATFDVGGSLMDYLGACSSSTRYAAQACGNNGRWAGGSPSCQYTGRSRTVAREMEHKWTPLQVLHAPYGGAAQATAGWSAVRSVWVGPFGFASHAESSNRLYTWDGMTMLFISLSLWGLYERQWETVCYHWGERTVGWRWAGYSAAIVDHSYYGQKVAGSIRHELLYKSPYTDADDATWFKATYGESAYESVHYHARYVTSDETRFSSGASHSATTSERTVLSISGGVVLGGKSVGLQLGASAATESSTYYEYTFGPRGTWRVDRLAGSSGSGWAFCAAHIVWCG